MKHLKTYPQREFRYNESRKSDGFNILEFMEFVRNSSVLLSNDMLSEINDIFLELRDEGYSIRLKDLNKTCDGTILNIYKKSSKSHWIAGHTAGQTLFTYTNEISEVIERIKDYVVQYGYDIYKHSFDRRFGKFITPEIGNDYYDIYINFTKK